MVVVVGETVIETPVPTNVPPQLPVYQRVEAFPPWAVNVAELPEQIVVVPVIEVGGFPFGAAVKVILMFALLPVAEINEGKAVSLVANLHLTSEPLK